MPDSVNNKRSGKTIVPLPKLDDSASGREVRDESGQYGDEQEILPRRRKRTDARVPILRKPPDEAEGGKAPKSKKASKKPGSGKGVALPAVTPKKRASKKRRKRQSVFELLSASGSGGPFKPIRVLGREIRFWPLIVLAAISLIGVGVMLNNSNLNITEQTVTVVGLPDDMEGYRIVVLTDLNGRRFGDSQSLLLRTLNGIKYDAIFCLGDMVGQRGNPQPFWELIEGLKDPSKLYFICGDSDPGPYVESARATEGILSQLILEDWILGAIERGANYVDAPIQVPVKKSTLWLSPATMLNLETTSTLAAWQDQTEQEEDGVRSGIQLDYNHLPITTYRAKLAQRLYDAQRTMGVSDIHISLAHEVPSEAFIYTSEDHDPQVERYLTSPELLLAGHYCGGVWRVPLLGAFYVPDKTLPRDGWFPTQDRVSGLSEIGECQVYISRGLSTNSALPLMPFRLFNSPEVSVLTLTSTLPENMLEAG
ncbi:MAG: metallophosphoesterase [Clostridia bacterium]|nr:metallophosphoesterase [Clostridia bacterium]